MKKLTINRFWLASSLILPSQYIFAQSGNGNNALNNSVLIIGGLVVLTAIVLLAENLLKVEARRNNINTNSQETSVFPGLRNLFQPKPPKYTAGYPLHTLSKGFDIKLEGGTAPAVTNANVKTFAIQPPNFRGIAPIPKVVVEVGDEVKAGDPLFFNKKTPDIIYAAPVSGEVIAINRGAKRAITEVVILADNDVQYRELPVLDYKHATREALVQYLLGTGFWPLINQRPFDVVADPQVTPRDIFISTFSTAPLAPNYDVLVDGRKDAFQRGLDVLGRLTSGDVYLGLNANGDQAPSPYFTGATGVKKHYFKGKHPAGNVGVQIHHIKPIGIGETVWTLDIQDVITLGNIFLNQVFDTRRVVALAGEHIGDMGYKRTYLGANIGQLVGDLSNAENPLRLVSGDALSGEAKSTDQFLNARTNLLTALQEGDYYELFGWLVPSKMRPSMSRTFPNFLFPNTSYTGDTNTHGEKRAFVVTGQYEAVLPMDIYPQHLMKAIMARDFERMEGLGIHELSEEDIALCEFVCTSKMPLQEILREGLDYMHEQG